MDRKIYQFCILLIGLYLSGSASATSLPELVASSYFKQRMDQVLSVSQVYLNVVRHQQLSHLSAKNKKTYAAVAEQMKLRVQAGLATAQALDQVESRLKDAMLLHQADQDALEKAQRAYQQRARVEARELERPEPATQWLPADLKEALVQLEPFHYPTQIEKAFRQLWVAHLPKYEKHAELNAQRSIARQQLESDAQQFVEGKRTLLDLLNSETRLFKANRAQAEIRYQLLLGEYQILAYTGKLHAYLGLSPVALTRADPSAMQMPAATEQSPISKVVVGETRDVRVVASPGSDIAVVQGTQWLLKQPAEQFTIQLLSTGNLLSAVGFVQAVDLKEHARVIKSQREGRAWYPVIYGRYPDLKSAQLAINQLPENMRKNSPWVRKIENLQRSLWVE